MARRTWSANVDIDFPITERLRVKGEFFTGENLSAYLGGVVQGINPTTFDNIRSTGGWVEAGYYWTPWFHSHLGYAIDDPFDQDSGRESAQVQPTDLRQLHLRHYEEVACRHGSQFLEDVVRRQTTRRRRPVRVRFEVCLLATTFSRHAWHRLLVRPVLTGNHSEAPADSLAFASLCLFGCIFRGRLLVFVRGRMLAPPPEAVWLLPRPRPAHGLSP